MQSENATLREARALCATQACGRAVDFGNLIE